MPIPETPYTRKEAYLNAAATGDSSGIPETPYTREEMYLDAIARGGGGGGGGSSTLSGLTDVDISNPSDGQTLVYNASAGKWENGAGGGSSSGVMVFEAIYGNDDSLTLSVTAETLFEAMQSSVCVVKTTDGLMSLVLWRASVWEELYSFDALHYAAVSLAATDMVILGFVED